MTTSNSQPSSLLTSFLIGHGTLKDERFVLADVGVSGGIHSCWQSFRDRLQVWGFDPLEGEIEILQRKNPQESHNYVAARVGCRSWTPDGRQSVRITKLNDHCYTRLASFWAEEMRQSDAVGRYDTSGSRRMTDNFIDLDGFFLDERNIAPNFVKTDTDQFDIDVLHGSTRLMSDKRLLGFSVECYFIGNIGDNANVFSNVDRLLRDHGFTLFDLEPIRYARKALPAPFLASAPCQSAVGQVTWAEAVYFRDLAHPDYENMWGIEPDPPEILKLACLFDVFGFPDCSADLLVKYKHKFDPEIVEDCLELLTPRLAGKKVGYNEYLRAFEAYVRDGYNGSLFEPEIPGITGTAIEWDVTRESLKLKDEIIASLKGIVCVQEETIRRLQAQETERLRRELIAQGLLKAE